jgi:hypothetical protein
MAGIPAAVSCIAVETTREILARMRKGFYYKDQYRHDPIVWDIGNGWCEEWALQFIWNWHFECADHDADPWPGGGRHDDNCPAMEWFEKEYTEDGDPYIADHCVVVFQGKYYDADRPEGVDNVWDLPMWEQTERPVE